MSIRTLFVPALAAAGFVLALQPAAAGEIPHHVSASGWHRPHAAAHYSGHSRHHGYGHRGYGHRRNGIRTLRALPILIEPENGSRPGARHQFAGTPGNRRTVPYTPAGPGATATAVSYFYGGDELPSVVPAGTYVGGIDAVRQPGNGTYIALDAGVFTGAGSASRRPSAKIITVTPDTGKAACDMEQGVCVIRP